jgi:O-antigen/teichoic acid export membrane protein
MQARAEAQAPDAGPASAATVAAHVRGSSLLLIGRGLAMAVAFLTQVLITRHLSKDDYGAFALGLSTALLVQSVLALGLDRADTRFLALYEDRADHARLLGVIVFEATTVVVLGSAVVVGLWALGAHLQDSLTDSSAAFDVLVVMVALAPIQALDLLVVNVFAVFASPWAVFLRRFVLDPGLRLLVALAVVIGGAGVVVLAIGYVAAGALGTALYVVLMIRLLSRRGFLHGDRPRRIVIPARALLGFSVPLLFTNLVAVASTELAAVALAHYGSVADVAAFRAVQPLAALNLVVMLSFATLYMPAAARMLARGDEHGVSTLYWQSAAWIGVLTFPVLCVMTALAHQVTVTSIGERYADSSPYLVILSIGYFLNAALGFNGLTVQMLGRVRYVMGTNVVVLAWMFGANLLLVPRWGAGGAAVAVLSTLVVHNVAKQAGLGFGAPVGVVNRRHTVVLAQIVIAALAVNALMAALRPPLTVGLVVVALASALLVRIVGPSLELQDTLPELARIPVLRWVIR